MKVMRPFVVTLLLIFSLCGCKKQDSPRIDKTAIIGKWKLKSLNRTVEFHQYHSHLYNTPSFSQVQTYSVNNEILDIKWHTDYLDADGNILSSSDAIGDNFESLDKTSTEIYRIFTLTIQFDEGKLGYIDYVSKKSDGTIMLTQSYDNYWNWVGRLGSADIWIDWPLPNFISSQYIYNLHDDTFVIRGKIVTGEPILSPLHPQYVVDDNEVIFERIH